MASSRSRITALGLMLWLEVAAGPVRALVGDSEGAIGLDGSLRTTTAATVNYRYPALFGDHRGDGLSQTALRLVLAGRPLPWLDFEIHGVQAVDFNTSSGAVVGPGLFAGAGHGVRYRGLDASWDWAEEPQLGARLWLDRCAVTIRLPFADLTVGRQAITFGKAYFWNPLDIFLAFDPRQFDRDYKPGVDALRLDIPLGDFSGLNLVAVAGRSLTALGDLPDGDVAGADWNGSAVLLRAFTTLWEFDLALQGGKVYGGYQVGGAFSGELGPLEVRGEAAYLFVADDDELPLLAGEPVVGGGLTAVLGLGHRFESTLVLEAEYLYNGPGDPERLEAAALRLAGGGALQMGRHLYALLASYEILPILNVSIAWLFSFSDFSSLLQPGLVLSVSDESELLLGALIGLGARPTAAGLQSEFGTYPNVYYLQYKLYF